MAKKSEYLDFLPDFLWVIKLVQMSFYPKGLEYLKNNIKLIVTKLCKLAQKSEYYGFLPDLGW